MRKTWEFFCLNELVKRITGKINLLDIWTLHKRNCESDNLIPFYTQGNVQAKLISALTEDDRKK